MAWPRPRDLGPLLRAGSALVLPCGRLLAVWSEPEAGPAEARWRCARTVVTLRTGDAADGSSPPPGVRAVELQATDDCGQWLPRLFAVLAEEGVEYPVLLQATGGAGLVDVAVAALWRALGAEDEAIASALSSRPGAIPGEALLALQTAEACFLETAVEGLRRSVLPLDAGLEAAHLKQDVRLVSKLARAAADAKALDGEFWCEELAAISERYAEISLPAEAAFALLVRGWALRQLTKPVEARESLEIGALLAVAGQAKPAVGEQIAKELTFLPAPGPSAHCIVDVCETSQAADPGRPVRVLDADSEGWRLLVAPAHFAWVIYDPPSVLLAVSASPIDTELHALEKLGIVTQMCAEAASSNHNQVVEDMAEAIKAGKGCLLHSSDGGKASCAALACFLVKYGLSSPDDWSLDQPSQSCEEAIDLAKGLRSMDAIDGAAVRFFEQTVWSELVMKQLRSRSGPSSEAEQDRPPDLPASTVVVRQPGDGNCLFHSLAYGLKKLGLGKSAGEVRKKICDFMGENPDLDISGTPLCEWVDMSARCTVGLYAQRMKQSGEWGGAPEIAVCANMAGIDINVYEQRRDGSFALMAPFYGGGASTLSILYVGRMHYDALQR